MPQVRIGSRNRKSPFFESTMDAGVTEFTIYNGMFMPTSFGDPVAEYRRLTEGVALWDVAVERQVEVSGPDAEAFSNYMSARDLRGMAVNRARYAPLCDHQARLINDPIALRVDDDRYWFSLADSEILLWARGLAGERGDDVEICEPDVSPLALQGPLAIDLARDLFGADVVDPMGMFHHRPVELDGIPIVLCRSGWSKQGGFELFLTDGSRGNELWDLVMAAGAAYDIGPGAPNHQERIESGLLSFAADHDRETDPIEAGLAAFTSLGGDHEFVGRAALEARLERTDRRPIVNVRLDGTPITCENAWPATRDDRPIGELRNAVWSTKLDAWIGIAQLVMPHHEPGTVFDVITPNGDVVNATVQPEPFGTILT